jgi:hypothetical protein
LERLGEEFRHQSALSFLKPTFLEKSPTVTFWFKYRSIGPLFCASSHHSFLIGDGRTTEFLRAIGIAPSRVPEKRRASASPEREVRRGVHYDHSENEDDPDVKEVRLLEVSLGLCPVPHCEANV